jgi:glycosyltransferase involved in cell wall biosynthesis
MLAAVVCAKLTPHHAVRLRALARAGEESGDRVAAIEVADFQRDYRWPETTGAPGAFERITLFPGSDYWSRSYREVHRALTRTLGRLSPDVVVLPGWAFQESWAGLLWAARRGVPRVLISDSQPIDNPRRFWRVWLKRRIVRQFQAALAGGRPHVRYLAELGLAAEQCFTGCDVVDNEFYAAVRRPPPPAGVPATLVSCLRFLPVKNIFGVLNALSPPGQPWNWLLAGYGPLEGEIRRRIRRLGLESRVTLAGAVPHFDTPRVYAQGHVYLQPSLSEPWGLAVNEAMASGLPLLVSNRCGCREDLLKDGENGFLFDPSEPGALERALGRMWLARERWPEMGQASRNMVAPWGPERYARNLWRACQAARASSAAGLGARSWAKALDLVCRHV